MKLRCLIGLHPWEKWSAPEMFQRTVTYNPMFPSLQNEIKTVAWIQERECVECGRVHRREVKG